MVGTLVNVAAIVAGATIGALLKRGIPAETQKTIMQGLGLAILLIGFKMAWQTQNELIPILSLVTGAILGECLNIEKNLMISGIG